MCQHPLVKQHYNYREKINSAINFSSKNSSLCSDSKYIPKSILRVRRNKNFDNNYVNAIRIRKFFAFSNFHWSLTSEHSHRHTFFRETFFFWWLVNSKDSFIISAYFFVQLHTLHMSSIRREINGKNSKIGVISFEKSIQCFFFGS